MQFQTTANEIEITLEIEYAMTYAVADNGATLWFPEWWTVTEVDGEKLSEESQREWDRLMKPDAEDIELAIMEEEA